MGMSIEEVREWLQIARTQVRMEMPQEWVEPVYGSLDMAIKALEQGPCDDAISRKAVHEVVDWWFGILQQNPDILQDAITTLPPVKPQEPKTGHWEYFKNEYGQHKIRCTCCEYVEPEHVTFSRNYCPNCGAKMTETEEA